MSVYINVYIVLKQYSINYRINGGGVMVYGNIRKITSGKKGMIDVGI